MTNLKTWFATTLVLAAGLAQGMSESGVPGDPPQTTPLEVGGIDAKLARELAAVLKENMELREKIKGSPEGNPTGSTEFEKVREELAKFLRKEYEGTNIDVYKKGVYLAVRIPELAYSLGQTKTPISASKKARPIAESAIRYGGVFDLLVEGHADKSRVKKGSNVGDNWQVAFDRAKGAADLMRSMRVPDSVIGVVSRGSGLATGGGNDRRVEFLFAPKRGEGTPPDVKTLAALSESKPTEKRVENKPQAKEPPKKVETASAQEAPRAQQVSMPSGDPVKPAAVESASSAPLPPVPPPSQVTPAPEAVDESGKPTAPETSSSTAIAAANGPDGLPELPALPGRSDAMVATRSVADIPTLPGGSGAGLPSLPALPELPAPPGQVNQPAATGNNEDVIELPVLPVR